MKLTRIATALTVLIATAAVPAAHTAIAAEKKAAPAAAAPAPAKQAASISSIKDGMTDAEVTGILGQPSSSSEHASGKQWIPGYMGSDLSHVEWIYKGQGRISFSRNRWSGTLKVIKVEPNPNM